MSRKAATQRLNMQFRVDDATYQRLNSIAEKTGMSTSEVGRRLMQNGLARLEVALSDDTSTGTPDPVRGFLLSSLVP